MLWPLVDLLPTLRHDPGVTVTTISPLGLVGILRFNHRNPPFDNAAVRRAILPALSQAEYMLAANGEDRSLWRDGVGYFTPGTPMASDVGMDAITAPRDLAKARAALAASGYNGARCVVMNPTDFAIYTAMANVTAALLTKIGFNVDLQAMDWATAMQRRTKPEPVDQGGWSIFHTGLGGMEEFYPGQQSPAARQRHERRARLAHQRTHRKPARRLAEGARYRHATTDRARYPGTGVRRCALCSNRAFVYADGVSFGFDQGY